MVPVAPAAQIRPAGLAAHFPPSAVKLRATRNNPRAPLPSLPQPFPRLRRRFPRLPQSFRELRLAVPGAPAAVPGAPAAIPAEFPQSLPELPQPFRELPQPFPKLPANHSGSLGNARQNPHFARRLLVNIIKTNGLQC